MAHEYDYDVIVVGSGFGGSVMTCRLAEKGLRVGLLERGRRYRMGEFPRRVDDFRQRLFWDPEDERYGYMEVRAFPDSDASAITASGLGGGSLIYANVLLRPAADFFKGWPGGITRQTLEPYYAQALQMLDGARYPIEQPFYHDTPKAHLMKQAFERLQDDDDALLPARFSYPQLAVRFKGDFPGHQTINDHGVIQSSCIKCGECDVGCNIHAKNTLDLNYLARATNAALLGERGVPAHIHTNAQVSDFAPHAQGGYEVTYSDPRVPQKCKTLRCRKLIISAGSIGSTALLLKMKKHTRLPHLSARLGHRWCGNGDLEGTIILPKPDAHPTNGPVIATSIDYRFKDYPDGFPHGLLLQEGGFPSFLAWFLAGKLPSPGSTGNILRLGARFLWQALTGIFRSRRARIERSEINLGDEVASLLDRDDLARRTLVMLGMGRDRSDGVVSLREDDTPMIKWNMDASELHFKRVRREMRKVAKALGGRYVDSPLTYMGKVIAVHNLGGCVMGDTPEQGVVDENGEAFGHPGLYVVDGSIMPTSLGANPSLTITAMAERIAERFTLDMETPS